ncbi:hypothetical protein GO306_02440 [Ralstonia solanacearum]|nr:hypothetical protein [Ralstonia solanacearum]
MTFCTMSACFLNSPSLARPPRSSMTLSMSTNLRSFSAPSAWPNTAALANFILASVGITSSAWCVSANTLMASRISSAFSTWLTP